MLLTIYSFWHTLGNKTDPGSLGGPADWRYKNVYRYGDQLLHESLFDLTVYHNHFVVSFFVYTYI